MTSSGATGARPVAASPVGSAGLEDAPPEHHSERPLRRDAAANLARIMAAAKQLFTERGLEVTLDDVAAAAGVGVGTVYRRFPDKRHLVAALFADEVDSMVALTESALAIEDPWEALTTFIWRALERQEGDRCLKQLLLSELPGDEQVAVAQNRIASLVGRLLERAQRAGVVRADLEGPDVFLTQLMVAVVSDRLRSIAPGAWRRQATLLIDGLRARPGELTRLPVAALTPEEFRQVLCQSDVSGS